MNIAEFDNDSSNQNKEKRPKHPCDTFHAYMLSGARFEPRFDMPILKAENFVPSAVVPFSVAKKPTWTNFDCAVHFCERDSDIEPFWNRPDRYFEKLLKFQAVIGLDLSTCADFPRPLKEWNVFRNRVCDSYIQRKGQRVVPLLRGDPDIIEREVAGLEQGCMFAISPRGCVKNIDDRQRFVHGLKFLVDSIQPKTILSYGGNSYGVLDYPISLGIAIHVYPSRGRGDLGGRCPKCQNSVADASTERAAREEVVAPAVAQTTQAEQASTPSPTIPLSPGIYSAIGPGT